MLGLGLNIQNQNYTDPLTEFKDCGLLAYTTPTIDHVGFETRESKIPKVFNGDGTWYGSFGLNNEPISYIDHTTGLTVNASTDVSGNFIFPTNGVRKLAINGKIFTPNEITDSTDSSQTLITSTDGKHTMQAMLTSSDWVVDDVNGVNDLNEKGYTVAKALGKNLFNGNLEVGTLQSVNGQPANAANRLRSAEYNLISGFDVVLSAINSKDSALLDLVIMQYDRDYNYLGTTSWQSNPLTVSIEPNSYWFKIIIRFDNEFSINVSDISNVQLEAGNTPTSYEAWKGYYKDEALTIPYQDGQPIQALQNSTTYCKGWVSDGQGGAVHGSLENIGQIKRDVQISGDNLTVTDSSGNIYPEIAKTDTTNTFHVDYTADVPVAKTVSITTLTDTNDQYFVTKDNNELKKLQIYDDTLTGDCLQKALNIKG